MFNKIFKSSIKKHKIQHISQRSPEENGFVCIAILLRYLNIPFDFEEMVGKYSNGSGLNLRQIIEILSSYNVASKAYRCSSNDINSLKLPCIIHWKLQEFVILTDIIDEEFYVCDPSMTEPIAIYNDSIFTCYYSEVALIIDQSELAENNLR